MLVIVACATTFSMWMGNVACMLEILYDWSAGSTCRW